MKTIISLFFVLGLLASNAAGKYKIVWQSNPTKKHEKKAEIWLDSLVNTGFRMMGEYPDTLRFFLAHNAEIYDGIGRARVKYRANEKGIYMDVNLNSSLGSLLASWEPPHEFCHLALPFLGKKNRWISEGFATFMSRQVMMGMDLYTQESVDVLYKNNFSEVAHHYDREIPFAEVADEKVKENNYAAYYRGGSSFFYVCDYFIFKRHKKRLRDIVFEYQSSNKKTDKGLNQIFLSLDELIGEPLFKKVLYFFRTTPASVIKHFVLTH